MKKSFTASGPGNVIGLTFNYTRNTANQFIVSKGVKIRNRYNQVMFVYDKAANNVVVV